MLVVRSHVPVRPMPSRRQFLRLGAAATAALAAPSWARAGLRPARWSAAPALPHATQEVYCTTWNGQIVVAGGLRSPADGNAMTSLRATAVFDPSTDTWSTGPPLPAPRHHIVLGAAGGTVYGFGGFVDESADTRFAYRDDVYAFDGTEWERIGAMPAPLGETVALSTGGRIHLVTGSLHGAGASGDTGTHLVYDPVVDAWSEARPAPTARSSATGAVIDGQLYVAAGLLTGDGVTTLDALERYDPETDEWTELRPVPQPTGGPAGAALDGRLYVFGGEYFDRGGGVYEQTSIYDPAADRWAEGPPMRTPRHGLAGTALDGRLFAMGGNTAAGVGAATADVVETLTPSDS